MNDSLERTGKVIESGQKALKEKVLQCRGRIQKSGFLVPESFSCGSGCNPRLVCDLQQTLRNCHHILSDQLFMYFRVESEICCSEERLSGFSRSELWPKEVAA
jgi:hypothetical protein